MKGAMDKISISRIEDLVSLIFSRVQYLLPWGLFAADRLVEAEAKVRGLYYENAIVSMAYLADAGVPSFDALKLVNLEFERSDSARLAAEYRRRGGLNLGVDILTWVGTQKFSVLQNIVAGRDNRKLDFDFERKYDELRKTIQ
jgi:hypothetical protein